MAAAVSSTNFSLASNFADPVSKQIGAYIAAREAFNKDGGQAFINDRREVRAAYCDATISPEVLQKWILSLPTQAVQEEFTHRIQEWDNKIAKGILKKNSAPTLSEAQFLDKLQAYYNTHKTFLEGPSFANFTKAKGNLRETLLPELKKATFNAVAKQFSITDKELISRMEYEWSWKA
jgi:hypothetical protein